MWLNSQETVELVTFTGKIVNEKLHFLCNVEPTSLLQYHYSFGQERSKILLHSGTLKVLAISESMQNARALKSLRPSRYLSTQGTRGLKEHLSPHALEVPLVNLWTPFHHIISVCPHTILVLSVNICLHLCFCHVG